MIIPMSGGGFKVFDKENKYIGAYWNEKLAKEIDKKGRLLTVEEFIKFTKKNADKRKINSKRRRI